MYVKSKMITDVITVFPEASISLAFQIMHEKNVNQLPVVKDGKLIGLVTQDTLKDFTPSKATTLSMYELNYVLNKTKVEEILIKNVETATESMLVEQVAKLMIVKDLNMIPIVKEDNILVGVISRTDIIDAFLELLGTKDKGTRISIGVQNEVGILSNIVGLIKELNMNIIHISNFNNIHEGDGELIIRVDAEEVTPLLDKIKANGFKIIRVDKN